MDESLSKTERLKKRAIIGQVFKTGRRITSFPLQLRALEIPQASRHQVAVSVPKKNFKKAVDRNHLKRLLREAYRQNKPEQNGKAYALFFIFKGREKIPFEKIQESVKQLLNQL